MRPRALLRDVRLLARGPLVRRGSLVAALSVTQRLLVPATAWSLFQHDLHAKLGLALGLSVVFTAHMLAQRISSALAQAALSERVAAAVLEGDVLRANLLPDADARAELMQALYHTAAAMAETVPALVADGASCVLLGLLVVWAEPGRVVALAAGLTLVAAGALAVSRRSVEKAVARAWAAQRRVYEAFADILDGRLEIVASGMRHRFLADLGDKTKAAAAAGVSIATSTTLSGRLPMLAIAGLVGLSLLASASLRQSARVTLADAALFASVTPAFAGIAQSLHGLARAEQWIRVVVRVLLGRRAPAGGSQTAAARPAPIVLDRVSFRYAEEGAEEALRDVDLTWDGAGALALAGPNGSGKSTCLRLILALARPASGRIVVGGVDLGDLDADGWRARIAFLPQRPYLPPRTDVRRAVRWLAPDAPDARITQALDRVGILGALGRGGQDPLAAAVDSLSVGQRQRVALARMLCRDAALYVLDEPDANLDREGIALVAGLLRELAQDRMVAFAAHTPELLAVASKVVTLDAGRVRG